MNNNSAESGKREGSFCWTLHYCSRIYFPKLFQDSSNQKQRQRRIWEKGGFILSTITWLEHFFFGTFFSGKLMTAKSSWSVPVIISKHFNILFPLRTHKETKIGWEPFLVNKDLLHNIFFLTEVSISIIIRVNQAKKFLKKPELDIPSKQITHLYKPGSREPDQEWREEEDQLSGFRVRVRKLLICINCYFI